MPAADWLGRLGPVLQTHEGNLQLEYCGDGERDIIVLSRNIGRLIKGEGDVAEKCFFTLVDNNLLF